MSYRPFNPWKLTSFLLGAALVTSLAREVPSADAAGPARLSKALTALKASKKFLEEAKDPPAPFHQQSMMEVTQAIGAVEREIKAYEAASAKEKEKEKKDGPKKDAASKPKKADAPKSDAPKTKRPSNDDAEE